MPVRKKDDGAQSLPHLVKDAVVLEHFSVSRRTLANLMKMENDPLPFVKMGKSLLFDLDEVAVWFERWKKRSRLEQEMLDIERKKARQRGRISILARG